MPPLLITVGATKAFWTRHEFMTCLYMWPDLPRCFKLAATKASRMPGHCLNPLDRTSVAHEHGR